MKNLRFAALAAFIVGASLASASKFYVVSDGNNMLQSFDTVTLAFTNIGALGPGGDFGDLSYGSNGSLYWLGGRGNNSLYTVNTTTGAASLVGGHGVNDLFGLGLDQSSGIMYATQFSGGTGIFTVNQATGAATQIGTSAAGLGGITYVPGTGVLASHDGGGEFYRINADGTTTLVNAGGGFIDDCDIAFDPTTGFLWAMDWSGNVFKYDTNNSYARTTVLTGQGAHDGLVYAGVVPEPATFAVVGLGALALLRRRRR
jgi:hypothetical protein